MNFKKDCLVVLGRDHVSEKLIQVVAIIICTGFKMHRKDPWIVRISHKNLSKVPVYKRRNSKWILLLLYFSVLDCTYLQLYIPVNPTAAVDGVKCRLE